MWYGHVGELSFCMNMSLVLIFYGERPVDNVKIERPRSKNISTIFSDIEINTQKEVKRDEMSASGEQEIVPHGYYFSHGSLNIFFSPPVFLVVIFFLSFIEI